MSSPDPRILRFAITAPQAGHSLDPDAVAKATEALTTLAGPAGPGPVRAVLLASDGPSFCSGGDVKGFQAAPDRQSHVTAMATGLHEFITALVTVPVPVVAAAPGWAAGAGMSILCACDVVVGGPSTRLRPAYPSIGFSPDGGLTWSLPRIIGPLRARDLLLTDSVVGGEDAARLGLITRLVPDDQIAAEAERLAQQFTTASASALARIKRLLREGAGRTLDGHLPYEAASIGETAASPDGAEGVDAFTERRRPNFRP
jgi:2-(1,2-epoxy-1,2-dihydrophenyl)acetyl-CoA isomerase